MNENDLKPWWNDEDAVGGAIATIILMTVVIVICVLVIAGAIRTGNWIIGNG